MKIKFLLFPLMAILLSACGLTSFSHPNAKGYYQMQKEQCVPYAREASGINLYGDAHTWWNSAENKYMRGQKPMPGSVLVLAQTNRMTHGHLAVVKKIVNNRQIDVTHTNWGNDWKSRRRVYESMLVEDVSPANDWSSVRFWNFEEDVFGFPYKAMGFIYNVKIAGK